MFWVFVWALIAFGVLGFAGWSYRILFKQKACWQAFAEKHGLEVLKGKWLEPVAVKGSIKGREVQIYTIADEQPATRSRLTHTHIEVFCENVPPATYIASRRPLPSFMQGLEQAEQVASNDERWPRMSSSTSNDAALLLPWFTPRRIAALQRLMTLPQEAQTFLIADGSQFYMVWRSLDPLEDGTKLNNIIKQLFLIAEQMDYIEGQENQAPKKAVLGKASSPAPHPSPDKTIDQSHDQTDDRHLPPSEEN